MSTGYPSIDKPWLKYYSEEAINDQIPKCSIFQNIYNSNAGELFNQTNRSLLVRMARTYCLARKLNRTSFRVFISSTFSDMRQYRDAVIAALNKADCIPYGMERFGATAVPPLDTCYEELGHSQIYICVLGMRYGSVDVDSEKSYTQLEYEKARELGIPILAFLIDEENAKIRDFSSCTNGRAIQWMEIKGPAF